MAAKPLWWREPETLVCGVRHHVVPARRFADLAPPWDGLRTSTVDGRILGRCIRCTAWLRVADPPRSGRLEQLRPEDVPRRGAALRQAIVLRVIAVERAVHSVVFGLAAVALVVLRVRLTSLQAQARSLTNAAGGTLAGQGQAASRSILQRELLRLLNLRQGTLGLLALTAAAYSVLEGAEAVGLWFERRWAEYLTVVATAGFLPFEIHDIALRVTVVRVGALVVNLAVLVYLVWRRHLFGIGGPDVEDDRIEALQAELAAEG